MGDVQEWPDAGQTALWQAVQAWRDDPEPWLVAAHPRLNETLRVNPLRDDQTWTEEIVRSLGGTPIKWLPEGGGGQGWEMPWARGKWPNDDAKLLLRALHDSGRITRQEAVSMIPVKLLDCTAGQNILDMCAAPGSKSTQLCEAVDDDGVVVANESNPGRANLLVSNSKRVGLTSMIVIRHDGRHLPRCPNPGYDRILVDAPCTGSGTTRKNPEIWRNWTERAGRKLNPLQVALVRKGAMLLAPGGRMVYSTCSMDPVENEAVVAEILRTCDWLQLVETEIEEKCPSLIARPGMVEWPILSELENLTEDEIVTISSPNEKEIVEALPLCRRIWSDESNAGGFFVAAFKHIQDDEVAAALMPASEMAEKQIRQPPNPTKNDEIPVSSELLDIIKDKWGAEYSRLFRRGSKVYTASNSIHDWFFASERMLRRGGRLPGSHWHPFQVIQAGLPTWELRKGVLQRPTSKGIHITAPKCNVRVHEIGVELLTEILVKGGPEIARAAEDIAGLENETSGGIILRHSDEDGTWWLPAWIGGKLTLMIPDCERTLLSYKLGLGVA
ncbi:MAG: RsmB/NOP family class I SAM-dependent RNA methyltransferase [Euryarchaeota archaeon]|nr:RsmB/NOP family class I SAM-dependent RNA methyltransferase [Euryarchaeota archaeon]